MVSGEKPFKAPDARRLEHLILSRRPPSPLEGRCPLGLQAIIARLLAPNAADRYDSAGEIREDLERFKSGQPTHAERDGWPARAADEPATRRTLPSAEHLDETTRRTTPAASPPQVPSTPAATSSPFPAGSRLPPEAPRRRAASARS